MSEADDTFIQNLNVSVLGGGSWGTTVASLIAKNCKTTIWLRDEASVEEINSKGTNSKYLGEARLTAGLVATHSLKEAAERADVIVVGIPSQNFRKVLEEAKPYIRPWVPIVSLSKGLEQGTNKRMTEIIKEVLPGHPPGVLTGPNLAKEIMAGSAAASVLAMEDENISVRLQPIFRSGLFRVYTNPDMIGCELGGVLKNVIAIAVGMGVGLGAGDNTTSMVITRGLAEVTRLGVAMGGQAETFSGLTGMGDLMATSMSPQSRNRSVGEKLGRGQGIEQIIEEMHMVAEGVKSAPVVMKIANDHGIKMPIAQEVYDVVIEGAPATKAFRGLLKSQAMSEADPG